MTRAVTVNLPLPARILSPNARPHYMAKAKAVKSHRRQACAVALAANPNRPMWKSATLHLAFTFPTKHKRDDDNLVAMCKPYRDGLKDAGIVEDDSGITLLPVSIGYGEPKLTMTVTGGGK